ncbi:MAG: alpha-mannosidase [Armatimonadota bacterium]
MAKRIFVVPHFHYDAAWQDTYEGYLRLCHRHILDALHIMRSDPDYRFVLDQVALIRPFLERYPEQREPFKQLVAEGRLEIVCGMQLMPDANMPSGESFLKQIEMGKGWCRAELETEVTVGWMLDVFGNHPQIPQLMVKSGFDCYVFGRCRPPDSPSEFMWKGLDGTELLCHWMPLHYVVLYPAPGNDYEFERFVEERVRQLSAHAVGDNLLMLSGMDFAAPQRHLPPLTKALNQRREDLDLELAVPSAFFEALKGQELPTVEGDFNAIFQGCYSSRIKVKQLSRRAEVALGNAERFTALAEALDLAPEPGAAKELERAWEPTLLAHFHDVICGCHIDAVYEETVADLNGAIAVAERQTDAATSAIAGRVTTAEAPLSLVVFNPLAWERSDVAQATVTVSEPGVPEICLRDDQGEPVPFQFVELERYPEGGIKKAEVLFLAAEVPGTGYRTYAVTHEATPEFESSLSCVGAAMGPIIHHVHQVSMKSDLFELTFDGWSGCLTSLTDLASGRELIDPHRPWGNTLTKEPDHADPWEYNGPCKGGATAPTHRPMPFPEAHQADFSHNYGGTALPSCGPVMAELNVASPFGAGHRAQRVRLYRGLRRMDFATTITNRDEWVRYRAAFPTTLGGGRITREIPFGAIEQPEGEYPAQNWIDLSGDDYGVALLNRGLPGNNATDGVLMVSLLKCTTLRRPDAEGAMEMGQTHTLEYALLPHAGDWRAAKVYRAGMEFNNPLRVVKVACGTGDLPARRALLRAEPENVIVSAVKRIDGGLLVRMYEAEGVRAKAVLELHRPLCGATAADLIGRPERGKVYFSENCLETHLSPFEVKAFLLEIG